MKFWKRSGSQSAPSSANLSSTTLAGSLAKSSSGSALAKKLPSITKSANASSTCQPTRKQRMQLLKCIIHHADSVQNKYLVPKQLLDPKIDSPKSSSLISMDSVSTMFTGNDTATAEINDKCYQRWHQVLQEGLVPMSVHALNLLQASAPAGDGAALDEEEAYFATIEGMDEEIQVMAILARAAALNDTVADSEENDMTNADGEKGMEQINAMMKCIAMLLFHIVLDASASGSSDGDANDATSAKNDTVAGYDGRVRHVMKLACVDVLTRAIIESVDGFEQIKVDCNDQAEEDGPEPSRYDVDEYSVWNLENIKAFLDQVDLGADAIFGTIYKAPSGGENGGKVLLENGDKQDSVDSQLEKDDQTAASGDLSMQSRDESGGGEKLMLESNAKQESEQTETQTDDQLAASDDVSVQSQSEACSDIPSQRLETDASIASDSSSSFEIQSEEIKVATPQSAHQTQIDQERELMGEQPEGDTNAGSDGEMTCDSKKASADEVDPGMTNEKGQDEIMKEIHDRRLFNAKFMATRKFELIERLVAIDVVRFLLAEERETKMREKEFGDQKDEEKAAPASSSSTADQGDIRDESSEEEIVQAGSEQASVTLSQYFNALDRSLKQNAKHIKRGAKIAGAGLALGTVFAITGGLAAPALAAGLGGIAALTGATTASSTALLAVLATFKAGAALFGVGGGGLAAYKMKKRTQGLSDFEIRRENIEQYMYGGASEEKMKRGIEAMLPQLHTTVAVTGWLRDNDIADFQLAWGIQPTCKYEKADDDKRRIRQMKRFYAVYNPPLVHLCESFMETLQYRLKKDFSWDRIWEQLEQKYGANPDHILPLDRPHYNEVFLSYEETEMIDSVLNDAKLTNLKRRGVEPVGDEIDFNEHDEISDFLAQMSPKKFKGKSIVDSETELEADLDALENELVNAVESDLALNSTDDDDEASPGRTDDTTDLGDQSDEKKMDAAVEESQGAGMALSVTVPAGNDSGLSPETSPSLQERMAKQREQQVSFLSSKGIIKNESDLREGAGSPKMSGAESSGGDAQDPPPVKRNEEQVDDFKDERCPVVWDWKRLYGTQDLHTVTWESKFLSSLCHIVENMALEVSSQATKVALQYSVIGAIISAVAIPSALATASKLIDDPYQIVLIRADEAGKELAKCLLQSDERRPVTLVGFSFGARVIYSCLRELARQQDIWEETRARKSNTTEKEDEKKKSIRSSFLYKKKKTDDEVTFEYDREPASLVADVIFIGLPRAIDKKVLTSCRRVTGGRLVNCYTRNDWLLSLMFVARGGTPCGTKPIKDVPGVENYDVTDLVESHTKYGNAIPGILQRVRFSEP